MSAKLIFTVLVLSIQLFMILQSSHGKPTNTSSVNSTTDTSSADTSILDLESDDINSTISYSETLSASLTVLSENETLAEPTSLMTANISAFSLNPSSTPEPDYYDEQNSTSSLIEPEDDLDTLSIHISNSTESSSTSSSLISISLDELEVAGSLDESVTATALKERNDQQFRKRIVDSVTSTNSLVDDTDSTPSGDVDDSIIVVSMSSNLNMDTVEPPDVNRETTREMMLNLDEMQTEVIISSSSWPSLPSSDTTTSAMEDVESISI